MNRVAKFEFVSNEEFAKGMNSMASDYCGKETERLLPKRGTNKSAGYDFFAPFDFTLNPGDSIVIPTGVKAWIEDGWFLMIVPRSGSGFKYRVQVYNTTGIIDADYYNNVKNEGHIFIKLINANRENKTWTVNKGDGIAQGIFIPHGITVDDDTNSERVGGLGSTSSNA